MSHCAVPATTLHSLCHGFYLIRAKHPLLTICTTTMNCMQAARIIFQEGYGSVHDYLHDPILKLLAIGLSAASVINWVQKVRH